MQNWKGQAAAELRALASAPARVLVLFSVSVKLRVFQAAPLAALRGGVLAARQKPVKKAALQRRRSEEVAEAGFRSGDGRAQGLRHAWAAPEKVEREGREVTALAVRSAVRRVQALSPARQGPERVEAEPAR